MKYILIDTNFLRYATKKGNEKVLEKWWRELDEKDIAKSGSSIQPVVTSFTILEAAGIKLKSNPLPLSVDLFQGKDSADIGKLVFDHAEQFYKNSCELREEYIKKKCEETKTFRSKDGMVFFDAVIYKNLDDADFVDDICHSLSLDYLFQYRYPTEVSNRMHQVFWLVLNDCLQRGSNLSFYRVVKRMWEYLPQKEREELFGKERFELLSKSFRMDSAADYVDTELIHFSVVGKFFSGVNTSIDIFTMDTEQTIRNRISLYKSVIDVVREKFQEGGLPTESFGQLKPGRIFICDLNGKVTATLNVQDVPPLTK